MKKMKRYLFFIFLISSHLAIAQTDSSLIRPVFAVKFLPTSLLSADPNIQFQFEYFVSNRSSIEIGYGFGNNRIFNERSNIKTDVYRLEYKYYLRPFAQNKRWVSYVAGEVVYKNVLQKRFAKRFVADDQYPKLIPFTLIGTDIAPRLKVGRACFSKDHHVFNFYAGLGLIFKNNFSDDIIAGDTFDTGGTSDIFGRRLGKQVKLSPTVGLSFGFGKTK